jgi:hypothetical protein
MGKTMSKQNVLTVITALTPDTVADEVVLMWDSFKIARQSWEEEMIELRAFLFATSTRTTESGQMGFHNSTTIPKLNHIATTLRANYNAHLFGNPNWIQFEPGDAEEALLAKSELITAYARTKASRKDYLGVNQTCVDDWVFSGACFAQQRYITEMGTNKLGEPYVLYQGPELSRISPADIVFDINASSFKDARKVLRKTYTLGDIAGMVADNSHPEFTKEMLDEMVTTRNFVRASGVSVATGGVSWKQQAMTRDGFGDMLSYMNSDLVEVHEFYGDMFSLATGEFKRKHKIVVIDRRKVIYDEPMGTANGSDYLYYSTPEQRPDNLMGMSPLARLVGMQYKLDKLENMRADVFDMIANPTVVERGDVDFYGIRGAPGGRYVVDEQGDVKYLVPDTTVLSADFQISNTLEMMEEMAGSPRNASGFRTPGEKTKFEVQFLDQAGSRVFRDRVARYENDFLGPILDDMIQLARDNLGDVDMISSTNDKFNTIDFINITRDELAVSGRLRAKGSSLYAERANALQNLVSIMGSPVAQIFQQHVSRIKLAKALEELGDFKQFGIIMDNIGVQEDQSTQRMANQSQESTATADAVAASPQEEPLADDEE